jgi:peptide-methionine (S)-S-oxide reductase
MKSITLAGGCFWGVQQYMKQVKGVVNTIVGYTQGSVSFPTYEMVCTGMTGHTEACKIDYNSEETSLNILLDHFFFIIDPTLLNQQAMDIGTQYRTGIYYYEEQDEKLILNYIETITCNYIDPIVVEVKPASEFWEAEEYHQDYLEKNPGGYCHINDSKYCAISKIDSIARNSKKNI